MFSDFNKELESHLPTANKAVTEESTQDQKTFEWFKDRLLAGFTGSKFPDLMKGTRSGDLFGLTAISVIRKAAMCRMMSEEGLEVYIRLEMAKDFRQTRWGNLYESEARQAYVVLTKFDVKETGFKVHKDISYVGGSFDGEVITEIDNGILEIKCPYDPDNHAVNRDLKLSGGITTKHTYYAQIQANIEIAGVKWCDFVSYDPRMIDEFKLIIIRVMRDQSYIDNLMNRAKIGQEVAKNYIGGMSIATALANAIENNK